MNLLWGPDVYATADQVFGRNYPFTFDYPYYFQSNDNDWTDSYYMLKYVDYSPNTIFALDYRIEIDQLQSSLSTAQSTIGSLSDDLATAQTSLDDANSKIDELLAVESSESGSLSAGAITGYSASGGTDRFATALATALEDWANGLASTLTIDDFDAGIDPPFDFLNGPLNKLVNQFIAPGFNGLLNNLTDSLALVLTPIAAIVDVFVDRAIDVVTSEAGDLFTWIRDNLIQPILDEVTDGVDDLWTWFKSHFASVFISGLVPGLSWLTIFLPELDISDILGIIINVVSGTQSFAEGLMSLINTIGSYTIDTGVYLLQAIISLVTHIFNVILDIAGVSVTTADLTPLWNNWISLMSDEQGDVSLAFIGTGIGLNSLPSSTFVVPTKLTFTNWGIEIDLWDMIFTAWLSFRGHWLQAVIPIIDLSIPFPLEAASYWALKDQVVPLSEYFVPVQPNAAYFSGSTTNFTWKDLCLDGFIADVLVFVGKHLGVTAKDALMYSIRLINTYRKPTLKDVIKRISPDGESMKYTGEVSIWDEIQTLSAKIDDTDSSISDLNASVDALNTSIKAVIGKINFI
jgi:hypothetical protein